jgi:subtilase family serine protease
MSNDFLDSVMAAYFGHEKLAVLKIVREPIDGGAPFDPESSFEVSLGIQQSGGMAPGATIVHYSIPGLSDHAILDAYTSIVDNNVADIVNSSSSGREGSFTAPYNGGVDFTWILQIFEDVFQQGNAQGITFVSASGDRGGLPLPSLECVSGQLSVFLPDAEWPVSSPHVIGVGSTNLSTSHQQSSQPCVEVRQRACFPSPCFSTW